MLSSRNTIHRTEADVRNDGTDEDASPGELVGAPLSEVRDTLDLVGLDEGAFVERMVGDLPEKPVNYEAIIDVNGGKESAEDTDATELDPGANNSAA
ncbi:hypothetical protein [Halomarina litorea]|uniref:hypothetical protein n=1 Tax=Halomarina litorea TaxID=2961595 RepID=UPI0020C4D48C|nr:hypothetical protein [Halomarina sp. BCD28]